MFVVIEAATNYIISARVCQTPEYNISSLILSSNLLLYFVFNGREIKFQRCKKIPKYDKY